MNPRVKSGLLLVATLILGMVLGGLLTGAIVQRRLESFAKIQTPVGMSLFLEDVIQPHSDEQREAIRAVLDAAGPGFIAIMEQTREEMKALRDSVRRALEPLLTEEQLKRLEARTRLGPGPFPFGRRKPPGSRGKGYGPDDSLGIPPHPDRYKRNPAPGGAPHDSSEGPSSTAALSGESGRQHHSLLICEN